ncbi:MAG: HEAT repeat domain-containing protein, partial [Planctomycetota bacterium]
ALYGAKAGGGEIGAAVKKHIRPLPSRRPKVPAGRNPLENMICRVAAVELTSGYAYAFDPTFARRTLALGEESYYAGRQCVKSDHVLLAQNAVAVLANYPTQQATKDLREIFEKGGDMVIRLRALSGLVRRGDKEVLPLLFAAVKKGDRLWTIRTLHALGQLRDPRGARVARAAMSGGLSDLDMLWSAIPALGRIADGKKETIAALRSIEAALRAKMGDSDTVEETAQPGPSGRVMEEKPGSKRRVLRQMAALALAANGDKPFADEILKRVKEKGHEAFHKSVWYVLVDCLAKMGPEGLKEVRNVVGGSAPDAVRVHALRALAREKGADAAYLDARCRSGPAVLRALALQLLADRDQERARKVCRDAVAAYSAGSDGAEAFFVGTAADVGGRIGAEWTPLPPAPSGGARGRTNTTSRRCRSPSSRRCWRF